MDDSLVQKLELDLGSAKGNHGSQIAIIRAWRDEADGLPYKRNTEDYGIVSKLIKKAIEGAVPSLTEPFLGSEICKVRGRDVPSDQKAEIATAALNYFWNYGITPEKFIEPLVRNLQTDGTVICKIGWKEGYPTVDEKPLDALLLDPSATKLEEAKFVIEQSKVSIADILGNSNWYGEHTLESLNQLDAASDEEFDVDKDGVDHSFNFEDRLRQLVSINTYYGQMEIDGELKSIVAIWSDNVLINMMDTPFPESWNGLPFITTDYIPVSGSIYGKGVASLLSDDQKLSTALQRAVLKQLDSSTIGQRGYREGTLDPANERRFKAGKDFKFRGDQPEFWEGGFNQLSPDIYALQDRIRESAEELSGVGRLNSGLDPRALNSNVSATASSIVNSNSQRRLLLIVRHIGSLLEQMFRKWLDLTVLMGENLSVKVGGEIVSLQGFDLEGNYDLTLDVVTDGQRQEKSEQLAMVLQQLGSNPNIPQSVTMDLTSEFVTSLGMYELGEKLKGLSQQMEQPDPEQQQMQQAAIQLEIQEKTAGIAKDQSASQLNQAKAIGEFVDAQNDSYGL